MNESRKKSLIQFYKWLKSGSLGRQSLSGNMPSFIHLQVWSGAMNEEVRGYYKESASRIWVEKVPKQKVDERLLIRVMSGYVKGAAISGHVVIDIIKAINLSEAGRQIMIELTEIGHTTQKRIQCDSGAQDYWMVKDFLENTSWTIQESKT